MIRLTSALTHYPLWVNPDHITDIGTGECNGEERTYVCLVTDTDRNQPPYYFTESPEEVARKVLEWRLAITYMPVAAQIGDTSWAKLCERELRKLAAGLEDARDD